MPYCSRRTGKDFRESILEAASAGLPIVATRVGGVEEVIGHGCDIRLYEAGDIDGLAREVETLVRESENGGQRASGVKSELPKEFHIEDMVKQYQSLYDKLRSLEREKLASSPAIQP